VPGLDIAATLLPATEVGGDYYDVLPTDDGCWIGVGDVAGHGLRSGLVMMMLQSVVAALVRRDPEAQPRELLRTVNAVLYDNVRERLRQDEHATLSLIHYRSRGELIFAGAHEDMLIWRSETGSVEAVPTPGTWIGATRDIDAVTSDSQVALRDGDVLVLYTDGVLEAQNAAGEQFGLARLMHALGRLAQQPTALIRDGLLASVREFMLEQRDDIALVVARHRTTA
jgi:sigma-B regulation protein RsbU (phosphoserine phosphatase)